MKILTVSFVVVVLDQISKLWVKNNLTFNSPVNVLGDFFRLTYVENPGIAFGIGVGSFLPIVSLFSTLAIFLILYYLYVERNNDLSLRFGLALILGGAIGNMIDRCYIIFQPDKYYGVIDFIDIGINHHRWYIFNIADSAVTVGIILYLLHSLITKHKITVSDNTDV